MSDTTIAWTDKSWNPVTGCTRGCSYCYARRMAQRLKGRHGYPADEPFRPTLHPERLLQPPEWPKPSRIFVCSMGDLFDPDVLHSWQASVWAVMETARQHTFQVLTKQPKNMREFLRAYHASYNWADGLWPLPNVHLGVTCEDQESLELRVPVLLRCDAAVRWVSLEPLLGEVDLSQWLFPWDPLTFKHGHAGYCDREHYPKLQWVVIGCDSTRGPKRRPCRLEWVEAIVQQCVDANVPVFVKQLDLGDRVSHEPSEWPSWARRREFPR